MVHYGEIATFESADSYHDAIVDLVRDENGLSRQVSQHIWTLSRSAQRKYRLVARSIHFLAGALAIGIASLAF